MISLLLAVIYLVFISLGLPDSLLGSGWPKMQVVFGVPSSYAGYISMTICFMTIISALLSPRMINRFHTKWIVISSIVLTILGLAGFSISHRYEMLFIFAIPYGLGAGAIDASINHYVASNYSGSVMNFLHCFYGVGAMISPYIMSLALKYAKWNEGYLWTAFVQTAILAIVIISLPLWKGNESEAEEDRQESAGIRESIKVPGVLLTLIAFFAYCSGEATCFLWTPSYFAGTKSGLSDERIAAFGALIFGGLMLGRLISGFIWIVTQSVVSIHEAKLFLSNAVNVPGNTLHIFIFTVISSICFILTFCIRNSNITNDTRIIFATFALEFDSKNFLYPYIGLTYDEERIKKERIDNIQADFTLGEWKVGTRFARWKWLKKDQFLREIIINKYSEAELVDELIKMKEELEPLADEIAKLIEV